jgi:pimeloyl-ACP methyl ester carboxylesterase
MGASDWRDHYSFNDFAADAEAVSRAAGLYEGGRKPIYIGHSFGGGQVFFAAASHPERMHAAILVDTGFGPPPEELARRQAQMELVRNIPTVDRPSRIYPTMEAALARFRLMPPQPAGTPSPTSSRGAPEEGPARDGSERLTWRFDPNMWDKLGTGDDDCGGDHAPPS